MVGNVELGRILCIILKHEPEIIGITIDPFGWAVVSELIAGMNKVGKPIDEVTLEEIVLNDTENSYTFNDDKTKIRANSGHTISVDVKAAPAVPPEFLYHGTAARFVDSIKRRGLMKQCRNHVHLSATYPAAINFGSRHGKSAILKINAKQMHDDGILFFSTENNVWLTDNVPVKYIIF